MQDAVVILSGMLEINGVGDTTYIEWEDLDRFNGGNAIFKGDKTQNLEFNGGKMPVDKNKKTEGQVLKECAITNGIASEKIFVTKDVENTAEEAVAVKKINKPK